MSRPATQNPRRAMWPALATGGIAIALVAIVVSVSSASDTPGVKAPAARPLVTGLDANPAGVPGAYPGSTAVDCTTTPDPGSFTAAWANATGTSNGCPMP